MRVLMYIIISLLLFQTAGASEISLSEKDLSSYIFKSNYEVRIKNEKLDSLEKNKRSTVQSFLPKISLMAGNENFEYVQRGFRTEPYYGAYAEINIYNGGRDNIGSKLTHLNFQKGKAEAKVLRFEQLEEAKKTFWELVYLLELKEKHHKALKLVVQNRKAAIKRIGAGVGTKSDKYEFDIKRTELEQDLKKANLEIEKEKGMLKILLGLSQEQELRISERLEHDHSWRKLLSHSEDEHGYLTKSFKVAADQKEVKLKLEGRQWLPKLDAYAFWEQRNRRAEYDVEFDRDRVQVAVGIRASWKLSSILLRKKRLNSLQAESLASSLRVDLEERKLENEIHSEIKELELLDGMVHSAEQNIVRAEQFFSLISKEYKRGVKNSGDMLSATEKLIESEIRKMKIVRDFHFAKAHIQTKFAK